ncbi:hypothetical protein OG568_44415 [Streptomyces sp. NBC_01450]|uniref:hypothetical protein n=1 Tax=Streptomyces sp. NBC_01450 TaxID=2903871 RepID=UPI002E30DC3E|nr:hypothetical protein [Streptomyces sp. NBC_01450]
MVRTGISCSGQERASIPHLSGVCRGRGQGGPHRPGHVPRTLTRRGTATDDTDAFVVEDGRYLSARWPGDAYLFARRYLALLGGTAE